MEPGEEPDLWSRLFVRVALVLSGPATLWLTSWGIVVASADRQSRAFWNWGSGLAVAASTAGLGLFVLATLRGLQREKLNERREFDRRLEMGLDRPALPLHPGVPPRGRPSTNWQLLPGECVRLAQDLERFSRDVDRGASDIDEYQGELARRASGLLDNVQEHMQVDDAAGHTSRIEHARSASAVRTLGTWFRELATEFTRHMQERIAGDRQRLHGRRSWSADS